MNTNSKKVRGGIRLSRLQRHITQSDPKLLKMNIKTIEDVRNVNEEWQVLELFFYSAYFRNHDAGEKKAMYRDSNPLSPKYYFI